MERVPIEEFTAAQLRVMLDEGELTVVGLVAAVLSRISAMNVDGPGIRAVIEVSDEALSIAEGLDAELAASRCRGPLHGIPVLLKDNIATADGMQNTAGSLALVGGLPQRDSTVAERLRAAGAVILGKANLSEWSYFRSIHAQSGWSARGGQTRNPYELRRSTAGSSSGPAAAVAAGFVPLAVGTETDGSIVYPASHTGIVGLKPTVGSVDGAGIIPIARSLDSAGPMARTVADAAALLAVLTGQEVDLGARPGPAALNGARLGILRASMGRSPGADAVFEAALARLVVAGAEIVDDVAAEVYHGVVASRLDELELYEWEIQDGFADYVTQYLDPGFPIRTLADVVRFNAEHPAEEMPFYGQELMERASRRGGLHEPAYRSLVERLQGHAREGIDAALREHGLDAIIAPTSAPAGLIDDVNGDSDHGTSVASVPSFAGYPIVSINAGYHRGLPVGLAMFAGAGSDARLLGLAHAAEAVLPAREAPRYLP